MAPVAGLPVVTMSLVVAVAARPVDGEAVADPAVDVGTAEVRRAVRLVPREAARVDVVITVHRVVGVLPVAAVAGPLIITVARRVARPAVLRVAELLITKVR